MLKSYYEILKVDRDASREEIKRAYRTLLERYRIRLGEEDFKQHAAILEKAYNVLYDDNKRAKYDRMLWEREGADARSEEARGQKQAAPERQDDGRANREPEMPQARMARTVAEVRKESRPKPEPGRSGRASYLAVDEPEEEQPVREKPKVTGLVIAIVVVVLLIAGGAYYFYNYMYIPENNYNKAISLVDQGNFEEAISVFSELKDYKDSPKRIENARRSIGYSYIKQKQYDKAMEVFTELGNDEDIIKCKTAQAEDLLGQKKYDEAVALYNEIGDTDGVSKSKYAQATSLLAAGKKDEAYAAFNALGSYKDSAGKVTQIKADMQAQLTNDLAAIDTAKIAIATFDEAKQSIVKLNDMDTLAKKFELDALYGSIESKWQSVESSYLAVYYRNAASKQNTRNKKYFDEVYLTNTNDEDSAEDEKTTHFKKSPDYVSLYADCLKGVSEKTLNVVWYKYKLDHATGEYTERSQVAESKPKELSEIKNSDSVLFSFKKNAFKYGTGLYAAEITVEEDSEPSALVFFYLQ
jgi:curved DNA-binding protein CbpA